MRRVLVPLLLIAIIVMASPSYAGWLIDFQGDNTHGGYGNQKGPIDYVFPNGEVGNYLEMQAVDAAASSSYDTTPMTWSGLVDSAGSATSVAFTFLGTDDLVGWAGTIAPPGNGQTGLNNDYMLVLPAGNSYGTTTDGSYDFEITGLSASTNYRLGLVSSSDYHNTKGLDFSFDGGAVARELRNAYLTNTIVTVQSDATGKITGTVSCPAGLTGEWGGMTIDLFPSGVIRQWNLDIGGDGISASSPQDTLPHPYGPDEFGYWNAMDVQALTGSNPEPYTVDPSVQMKDSDGTLTNVTFTLLGNCGGWT
ncbi:MAG: hypothetical protein JW818_11705, partial [Pirellulales bacterium]|nr:hypothetical protein [Pirellulales bacterium]